MVKVKEKQKTKSKERGITLVALVITIIVLLILAGVALSSLFGENGILNNAESAKEETRYENAKEQMQLAVQSALTEGLGVLTTDNLEKELPNFVPSGTTYSIVEGEDAWTITIDGITFEVSKTGKIEDGTPEGGAGDGGSGEGGTGGSGSGSGENVELKWMYSDNGDGTATITGLDLSSYTCEIKNPAEAFLYTEMTMALGVTTLEIPSTIDSKTVVKFDWKDTKLPTGFIMHGDTEEVGKLAFNDVTKVVFADTITEISNTYTNVDFGFPKVTELHLPNNLVKLGDWACVAYTSLESVTIPSTVTSIGYRAFSRCMALTSITIPSGVTTIGDKAFSMCIALQNVTISGDLTSIGNAAFTGCSSLQSIDIPNTVTSIGNSAFPFNGGTMTVNFPNGTHADLTIETGNKWGASKLTISGVEQ